MTLFESVFSSLSHKSTPVMVPNISIGSWCAQLRTEPTRFVKKIEMCTALTAGRDAHVDKAHFHTLLRVSVLPMPSGSGAEEDVLLVERVLCIRGAYHSVMPNSDVLSTSGTLFHPDVHDRICVVPDGSSVVLAHRIEAERTLTFGNGPSDPHLTLVQLAQVLEFVSRTTKSMCAGGDCKFQSRSFAFTCLAALTPRMPPRGMSTNGKHRASMVDDSVFERGAEAFFGQMPWLVQDPLSTQALRLIGLLKGPPRERARLYH